MLFAHVVRFIIRLLTHIVRIWNKTVHGLVNQDVRLVHVSNEHLEKHFELSIVLLTCMSRDVHDFKYSSEMYP